MFPSKLPAGCVAVALLAPVASPADPWKDESGHGRVESRDEFWPDRDRHDRSARLWEPGDPIPPFFPLRLAEPRIPPGHQPPPGECRVWLPDRPPGQQPPPFRC